ncbi:MAG: GNAT family N-acetyltransferase [Lysobacterales bacterium]|jgi:RimJ/RimL family protein N-acetyltransferase
MDSPRIETDRLVLRLPQREDFDGYAELLGDEVAARFIGGQLSRDAAWRKFLQMPGAWAIQGFGMFSVIDRASGQWLGQLGPWKPEGWPGNEVGWSFLRSAWGRGLATEAGRAAITWAFEHLDWINIIHCIDPGNTASQKLAERLGSSNLRTGNLPAPYQDHVVDIWGQTRDQWRRNNTQS